jgi:two-component system nitrate/nitrite response regulator NarL
MGKKIQVAILDDHPAVVDGYLYRLSKDPQIEVTATLSVGEELEPALKNAPADVLLLDVNVPTSAENRNPYPILHVIPKLLEAHPDLNILVISMHADRALIRAVMDAGANGYILKDDQSTFKNLGSVVRSVAADGIHFSPEAHALYKKHLSAEDDVQLSKRQLEALSLCASQPNIKTSEIARLMKIKHSTARNLLSVAYFKLGVGNRAAAILKARQMGLITPYQPETPNLQ